MPFENSSAPDDLRLRHDRSYTEIYVRSLNERFADFLERDFARLHEGGVPDTLVEILSDAWISVAAGQRDRELAWFRRAFDERVEAVDPAQMTGKFLQAVAAVHELLGDTYEAHGLSEEMKRDEEALAPPLRPSGWLSWPPRPSGAADLARAAEAYEARVIPSEIANAPTGKPIRSAVSSIPVWRADLSSRLSG